MIGRGEERRRKHHSAAENVSEFTEFTKSGFTSGSPDTRSDMTSLNHDSYRAALNRIIQKLPNDEMGDRRRSALMWLSVAEKCLRAHELWIAIEIAGSVDFDYVLELLTGPGYVDDQAAAASLRNLLGDLITLTEDGTHPEIIHASLGSPELRTMLADLEKSRAAIPEALRQTGFSTTQAHVSVASACMAICLLTTLHLAHVNDKKIASSLIQYAWTNWNFHLSLTGYTLEDPIPAKRVNKMIADVSRDLLVFLLALNDFLGGPVVLPGAASRVDCAARIQQAQRALERPLVLLTELTGQKGYAETLSAAMKIFQASKYSGRTTSTSGPASTSKPPSRLIPGTASTKKIKPITKPATTPLPKHAKNAANRAQVASKTEKLRIDPLLLATEHLFGDKERQMVRGFAELARGLRGLCIALAHPALYDAVLKQFDGDWSPLDILAITADWTETVASYPYQQNLLVVEAYNPFSVSDLRDNNYIAAQFVLDRIAKNPGNFPSQLDMASGVKASAKPADISSLRRFAASAVYKLKGPRIGSGPEATFTINDGPILAAEPSSSSSFPAHLYTPSTPSLRHIYALLPPTATQLLHQHTTTFLTWLSTTTSLLASLEISSSILFTFNTPLNWPALKSALLASGYRIALLHAVIAILINHIRRIRLPQLFGFLFYRPMDDLRLSLSNPDIYLSQTLSYSWSWAAFSHLQKTALEIVALVAFNLLLTDNGRLPQTTIEGLRGRPASVVGLFEGAMHLVRIFYGVYTLVALDYIFSRSVHTVALLLAVGRLIAGGDEEHIALGDAVKREWIKGLVLGYMAWFYARHALWNTVWGAVLAAVMGRPGLLVGICAVVGGVVGMVRWRARLYILLEMSGMFVVLGLVVGMVVLLVREFVRDPLGLEASREVMRWRGEEARRVLPAGWEERIGVLRERREVPATEWRRGRARDRGW